MAGAAVTADAAPALAGRCARVPDVRAHSVPGRGRAERQRVVSAYLKRRSVDNETNIAMKGQFRRGSAWDAVDAIKPAQQEGRGVAGVGKTVVGTREVL